MPKAPRSKYKCGRAAKPAPPIPHEPLCYFVPAQSSSNDPSRPKSGNADATNPHQIARAEKRWIEFDFAFARDHFAKACTAEMKVPKTGLTTEERVKRWNEWARVGDEDGQAAGGKKKVGMAEASRAKTQNTFPMRGSHLQEASNLASPADHADVDVKAVLAHSDLAGLRGA